MVTESLERGRHSKVSASDLHPVHTEPRRWNWFGSGQCSNALVLSTRCPASEPREFNAAAPRVLYWRSLGPRAGNARAWCSWHEPKWAAGSCAVLGGASPPPLCLSPPPAAWLGGAGGNEPAGPGAQSGARLTQGEGSHPPLAGVIDRVVVLGRLVATGGASARSARRVTSACGTWRPSGPPQSARRAARD